ncbi:HAD-IIIC family phosphatase [Roseburia sp. 1XD42-69]|uniref:HAD-IIIC family phosphatase n=1 Tax=Roseburia sp. 1XD42-69 TaxID=2320088 RepID=UPI000EA26885|nr:HAD-IIIC family phosphatase [Roseburia sp. 1XD42-69]RKJ60949.1 HAD-IIIC family phosphatase [Roseburia sp. 1XD42-69]
MYSFRELQKACKKEAGGKEIRLAVLGNCATQFFSQAVKGYGRLSGLNLTVFDADYNQIATQLLNPSSEVYGFGADKILIWLCTEKIYEEYLAEEVSLRNAFAETYMQKIQHYWDLIENNSKAQILQMNFFEIDDKALGNYSSKMDFTFIYQIRKLNYLLAEAEAKNGKVYPVDALSLQLNLGRDFFFDAALYYHAKMSVSMDALPYLAKAVIDVVNAMNGKIKKCVILDLDNTLWGGIIGDDGMGGIEIGEYGKGHVFTNLQRWIKQLKDCGIILAVCSKNEADIAREPFEKHEEMILRLADISIFVANWNDKASNIKMIQESLNIGMDSIVFLDDNPVERNLVKEKCPDIEVPELPKDPALWLDFLQRKNYFETASYTGSGSDRTKLYQREFERKSHQQSFETIDDYLQNLMMEGRAKAFEPVKYPRIAQLTQRTNQFNLRTVRYTEDDIKRLAEDKGFITLYYTLKDKFGDYGLVSVVILKKTSEKDLFVDTWLMSCRVFKRGMEEFVMNHVVQTAKENGFETISSQYIPTKKNQMVKDIYEAMGFNRDGENLFHLDLDTFKTAKTYIKEADSDE